jgi:dipeptidyl aminopeptidase/acylaminoacyl peptidase
VGLVGAWLALLAAHGGPPAAADPTDGALVDVQPCGARRPAYEEALAGVRDAYRREVESAARVARMALRPLEGLEEVVPDREEYEQRDHGASECLRIRYLSDGLRVAGFVWKPRDAAGRRLPAIVYNRGGNRGFAALRPWMRDGFHGYVSAGFVVLGSQYRGSGGGEGRDEFGGGDVADVLNLLRLARSLDYVDAGNVFMLGESRGGMMAALALKQGARVNAAAIVSGLFDLEDFARRRPEIEATYAALIPDYASRPAEVLRERSAVHWPQRLDAPLLLLHGTLDWRVDAGQSLALAAALQRLRRPYELHVYEGDAHGLPWNWRDRDRRVVEWFRRHSTATR